MQKQRKLPKELLTPISLPCPLCVNKEAADALIRAAKEKKVQLLQKHYSQPELTSEVILKLAENFIPGFRLTWTRPRGPRQFTNSPSGLLFYEFVQLHAKKHKCSEAEAVRALYKQSNGRMLLPAKMTESTLQRRYREIKELVQSDRIDFVTEEVGESENHDERASSYGKVIYKNTGKCNHSEILESWALGAKREKYPLDQLFDQFRQKK